MAVPQNWICYECSQSFYPNQDFYECTVCRVRFCPRCRQTRHPQQHSPYVILLHKPAAAANAYSEQCVGCQRQASLRYSCQTCYYAKCLQCWHDSNVDQHEHRTFTLFEHREGTVRMQRALPPRSQSAPMIAKPASAISNMPPLQQFHTQPATPTAPLQKATKKRHSVGRAFQKAYGMTQKNAFTKIATGIALGTASAVIGADIASAFDGLGDLDFGGGGGMDSTTMGGSDGTGQDFSDLNQGMGGGQPVSSSPDLSSLQNGSADTTQWMQQQYWQNVQLPNLAGPTMSPAMMNAT